MLNEGHWHNFLDIISNDKADSDSEEARTTGRTLRSGLSYPRAYNRSDATRNALMDEWLRRMLAVGATATLDMPTCWFWEELLDRTPGAKVILGKRVVRSGGGGGGGGGADDDDDVGMQWMESLSHTLSALSPGNYLPFSWISNMSPEDVSLMYEFFMRDAQYELKLWAPWWACLLYTSPSPRDRG